jgi:hypothetical protein
LRLNSDIQQAARKAERRFPVRIGIAVPPQGLGSRLDQIIAWLDTNCGADGWTSTPSSFAFGETARSASTRGVVNDGLAIYFADVTLTSAFVAHWCAAQRVEVMDGIYRVRDDHRSPHQPDHDWGWQSDEGRILNWQRGSVSSSVAN